MDWMIFSSFHHFKDDLESLEFKKLLENENYSLIGSRREQPTTSSSRGRLLFQIVILTRIKSNHSRNSSNFTSTLLDTVTLATIVLLWLVERRIMYPNITS